MAAPKSRARLELERKAAALEAEIAELESEGATIVLLMGFDISPLAGPDAPAVKSNEQQPDGSWRLEIWMKPPVAAMARWRKAWNAYRSSPERAAERAALGGPALDVVPQVSTIVDTAGEAESEAEAATAAPVELAMRGQSHGIDSSDEPPAEPAWSQPRPAQEHVWSSQRSRRGESITKGVENAEF